MQKNNIINKCFLGAFIALVMLSSCKKEDLTTDGTGDSVNLGRDMVLYMTFDNNTCTDISGKGFSGVTVGSVQYVTDTPNRKGKAISIDGTAEQYVNIPYTVVGDSLNFSVSLWVKDFGTGTLFSTIEGNYVQAPAIFIMSNTTPRIYYSGGSREDFTYSLQNYQSSGWHMITYTASHRQQELCLYIDGQRVDSRKVNGCRSKGNKMQIGGNADGYFEAWADPMLIDNFRVYRRCLTTNEVRELYYQERQ